MQTRLGFAVTALINSDCRIVAYPDLARNLEADWSATRAVGTCVPLP
jgi:hypothetical protein